MAEIERVDIVKLTISNGEFQTIKKALECLAQGYCDGTLLDEQAAYKLGQELDGK